MIKPKSKTQAVKIQGLSVDTFRLVGLQEKAAPLLKQFERKKTIHKVSVRRLLALVRKNLQAALQKALFEENNTTIQSEITKSISDYLGGLSRRNQIIDYVVTCDATNNPQSTIDQNDLRVEIAFKPSESKEFFYVYGSFE